MTESAFAPRDRSALAQLVDLHPSLYAFLQETTHWAKDLPLPDQVAIEIIHTASTQRIYKAQCSTFGVQLIPGGSIGLYVGETYKLRVLRTDLVDETSRDFTPSTDVPCELALRVQRAFATVRVTWL